MPSMLFPKTDITHAKISVLNIAAGENPYFVDWDLGKGILGSWEGFGIELQNYLKNAQGQTSSSLECRVHFNCFNLDHFGKRGRGLH